MVSSKRQPSTTEHARRDLQHPRPNGYFSSDRSAPVIAAFESPNWRAMADGFTPAFMAARTRFALAGLTESDARLRLEACGGFAVVAGTGFDGRVNVRCRRAVAAATPAASRANSSSLRTA